MRIDEALKAKMIKDDFQRLFLNLTYTSIWLEERMNSIFKKTDITSHQYNVLRILRGSKNIPLPACEIQNRMIYKNSNVTRIIEKLVLKNLVSKRSNEENRRKINVEITEQGMQLLQELDDVIMKSHHELFQNITAEEALHFNEVLDKIRG